MTVLRNLPLALVPITLLAGCGGGGSASNVGSTPTPPAATYTTLANATSSTTLSTKGAVYGTERLNNASSATGRSGMSSVEISYDAVSRTYTLRGTPIGSTTSVEQSFGPSDAAAGLPAGNYDKTTSSPGNTQVSRLQVNEPATFTYVNFGHWTVGSTVGVDQRFNDIYFAYGIATQAADMPKTGSATYTLGVGGSGTGALMNGRGTMTANFAANTVNISLETQFIYRANQTFSPFATLTGSGAISANGFMAQLSGGDGYAGSIDGQFYGPAAVEVGAGLTITQRGGIIAAGAVSGKKD